MNNDVNSLSYQRNVTNLPDMTEIRETLLNVPKQVTVNIFIIVPKYFNLTSQFNVLVQKTQQ